MDTAQVTLCPVAALEAAPKMMGAVVLAATAKGLAGFEVTPVGSAPSVTSTEPVKPFTGFTVRLTVELVAPCAMETEVVEREIKKSGAGGGGSCVNAEDPAPQPAHTDTSSASAAIGTPWRNRPIERPHVSSARAAGGGKKPKRPTR